MDRKTLDLWVGLFVLAGLAALLVLAMKAGNLSASDVSSNTYRINAAFDNIGSLKVRAPVKAAGVVVGRVADIRFDNGNYNALVTLHIDHRYAFPRDTSAAIMTSGLLGEQYIALSAGGDTTMLKDGDKLKVTQSAVVLEQLIGQMLYEKSHGDTNK